MLVQESVVAKIIGVCFLLLYLAIQVAEKHIKAPEITRVIKPKTILAFKVENPHKNTLEKWFRGCGDVNKELQGICAIKTNDIPYSWTLSFEACYLIQEDIFTSILQDVSQALKKLPKVKESSQKNRKIWINAGGITGEELINTSAVALDKSLLKFRTQWILATKKIMQSHNRLKYRSENIWVTIAHQLIGNSSKLKKILSRYPVYTPPYPGESSILSRSEGRENFRYFEKVKNNRMTLITDILADFDLYIDYKKPDQNSLLQLDGWAYQQWPSMVRRKIVKSDVHSFSLKSNYAAIRSFLFDISIFIGECYLSINPNARWFLDDTIFSKEDERTSCNRIIILLPSEESHAENWLNIFDVEAHVFFHYSLQKNSISMIDLDKNIGRVLTEPLLDELNNGQTQ